MYIGIYNNKNSYYNYFSKFKFSTKSSPDFVDFYSAHKFIDPDWLTWFIGFSEGDGGLHINKNSCLFGLTQSEESIFPRTDAPLQEGLAFL